MRLYETTFILNPQADDVALDNQVKAVQSIITGNGGKIVAEERMGTRRLAYEINGLMQGYYSSFLFEAPPKVLPKLERHYKLEDPYIRYLTIHFEEDPEVVRERQQAMAAAMEANERLRRHSHSGSRRYGRHTDDSHETTESAHTNAEETDDREKREGQVVDSTTADSPTDERSKTDFGESTESTANDKGQEENRDEDEL